MKEIDDYDLFDQDFAEFLRRGREEFAVSAASEENVKASLEERSDAK